jgi:hypothetical protein
MQDVGVELRQIKLDLKKIQCENSYSFHLSQYTKNGGSF